MWRFLAKLVVPKLCARGYPWQYGPLVLYDMLPGKWRYLSFHNPIWWCLSYLIGEFSCLRVPYPSYLWWIAWLAQEWGSNITIAYNLGCELPPKVDLHWSSVALPNPEAGGAWVGPSILVFAARIPPKSLPYLHSWFPKNSIVGLDLYVVWQHSKLESLC